MRKLEQKKDHHPAGGTRYKVQDEKGDAVKQGLEKGQGLLFRKEIGYESGCIS